LPNKKVHLIAGVVTGAVISLVRVQFADNGALFLDSPMGALSLSTIVLISAAIGGQFGLLPDILEPSKRKKWRHRRFFHSYTVLVLLLWFTYQTETNLELSDFTRHLFTVAAAGYLSHLLLDSRTPAGLPWI